MSLASSTCVKATPLTDRTAFAVVSQDLVEAQHMLATILHTLTLLLGKPWRLLLQTRPSPPPQSTGPAVCWYVASHKDACQPICVLGEEKPASRINCYLVTAMCPDALRAPSERLMAETICYMSHHPCNRIETVDGCPKEHTALLTECLSIQP